MLHDVNAMISCYGMSYGVILVSYDVMMSYNVILMMTYDVMPLLWCL